MNGCARGAGLDLALDRCRVQPFQGVVQEQRVLNGDLLVPVSAAVGTSYFLLIFVPTALAVRRPCT